MKQLTGWRKRIAAAKKRGSFTEEDRADAAEWSSCAIGEARQVYPKRAGVTAWDFTWDRPSKDPGFGPKSELMQEEGMSFYGAVWANEPIAALRHLKRIEAGR